VAIEEDALLVTADHRHRSQANAEGSIVELAAWSG